jgi:hypothetical protein
MTKDDLVFLGGQYHVTIGRDKRIEQASFVARVGKKAPAEITDPEVRAAYEEKRVETVEIRISRTVTLLDTATASLESKARDKALTRFAPEAVPSAPDGEVI